ncbi:hypothetical protein [Paraburkholderia tropica]|uniref:hypothetical protein n=1 Tax=Paraburkholderia tropica TaxID=92647 RepID=UPI002AB63E92|nr:hypothetical protein [Paraburkholderia tropica]
MPALLPMVMVLFFAGLIAQTGLLSQSVAGAGAAGALESAAAQRAAAAEVYAAACVEAALEQGDVVSSSITVTLPAGVIAPDDAGCMTTSASSGLNVFAYVPSVPGAAGRIRANTLGDMSWYAVRASGTAINLSTGTSYTVSSSIPSGELLDWVVINP